MVNDAAPPAFLGIACDLDDHHHTAPLAAAADVVDASFPAAVSVLRAVSRPREAHWYASRLVSVAARTARPQYHTIGNQDDLASVVLSS